MIPLGIDQSLAAQKVRALCARGTCPLCIIVQAQTTCAARGIIVEGAAQTASSSSSSSAVAFLLGALPLALALFLVDLP